jgi:hypothetical protein
MTTYLTLVGMLLLVVSPLLIPVTVTVIPFAPTDSVLSPSRVRPRRFPDRSRC